MLRLGQKVPAESSVLLYMVSQNHQLLLTDFLIKFPENFNESHAISQLSSKYCKYFNI